MMSLAEELQLQRSYLMEEKGLQARECTLRANEEGESGDEAQMQASQEAQQETRQEKGLRVWFVELRSLLKVLVQQQQVGKVSVYK